MPIQLIQLLDGVKSRLQLTEDTIIARLPITSTPLAPALTNDQVMTGFLNDGGNHICRDVYAVLAPVAYYTMPADSSIIRLQDVTDPQGRVLHYSRSVSVNCIPVESSGFEQMQMGLDGYLDAPFTQPKYYWNDTGTTGFNQVQEAGTPVQIMGYCLQIPFDTTAPLDTTQMLDSIQDIDAINAMEFYCCWMICSNLQMNVNLGPRRQEYQSLYQDQRVILAKRLMAAQPDLANFFPTAADLAGIQSGPSGVTS